MTRTQYHRAAAIIPPGFLKAQCNEFFINSLKDSNAPFDFRHPEGEPAMIPSDSVSWCVFKNPVTIYIAGMSTMLYELAEPRIRAGAWERGSLRTNTARRLKRTGYSSLAGVYAPRSQFQRHVAKINVLHQHMQGITACGKPFHAADPELLNWTHNVSTYSFVRATEEFTNTLDRKSADRFMVESTIPAELFGVKDAATSVDEIHGYLENVYAGRAGYPKPEKDNAVFEFMDLARHADVMPRQLRYLQPLFLRAAVDIIPPDMRAMIGLGEQHGLSATQKIIVRQAGKLSNRILIEQHPAIQSCQRLGLDDTYLYQI